MPGFPPRLRRALLELEELSPDKRGKTVSLRRQSGGLRLFNT